MHPNFNRLVSRSIEYLHYMPNSITANITIKHKFLIKTCKRARAQNLPNSTPKSPWHNLQLKTIPFKKSSEHQTWKLNFPEVAGLIINSRYMMSPLEDNIQLLLAWTPIGDHLLALEPLRISHKSRGEKEKTKKKLSR